MATKEYREFFLRAVKQTSGSKPDQEANYAVSYLRKGVTVFNRFLANHFPTEGVMRKFLESIPFKLNPEDTATTTVQGLTKKATDANAESRTANTSSDVTAAVVTHQLPEVVVATDGSDVAGTEVKANGISVTPVKRTLASIFRRNYLIKALYRYSLEADVTTKSLQLVNDANAPGNNYRYGTSSAGTKGWVHQGASLEVVLDQDFSALTTTADPIVGTVASTFKHTLPASANRYRFRVWMPVDLVMADGCKVNVTFSGTASNILYDIAFRDNTTMDNEYLARNSAFNQNDDFNGFSAGTVLIEGSFLVTAPGDLEIKLGTQAGAGPATAKNGSYFIAREVTR